MKIKEMPKDSRPRERFLKRKKIFVSKGGENVEV